MWHVIVIELEKLCGEFTDPPNLTELLQVLNPAVLHSIQKHEAQVVLIVDFGALFAYVEQLLCWVVYENLLGVILPISNADHFHRVDVEAELMLAEAFKNGRTDQVLVPEYEASYFLLDPRSRIRNNAATAVLVPLFDRSWECLNTLRAHIFKSEDEIW